MCEACTADGVTEADKKAIKAAAAEVLDRLEANSNLRLATLGLVLKNTVGVPVDAVTVLDGVKRDTEFLLRMLRVSSGITQVDDLLTESNPT